LNDLVISIGSLIIGIVATVWASNYYFRKSLKKSLTPYIQYYASPFRGIDPSVRKDLGITYQGNSVDDLFEIQFLIANTGDKAIRDIIEPLSLEIPDHCTLLDASIIHKNPTELKVDASALEDKSRLHFEFPLLNSGDFFIAKLLLNGTPKTEDLKFTVVVDELPPTLKPERLGYDAISSPSKKHEFEFSLLGVGLTFAVSGLSSFKVIYDSWHVVPSIGQGVSEFLSHISFGSAAVILSIIPAFIFLLIGVMMTASTFTDGRFPPTKRKFIVPDDIRRSHFRVLVRDEDF
jgi:hypothetical protein